MSTYAIEATVRLYHPLVVHNSSSEEGDFLDHINPNSLEIYERCKVESSLVNVKAGERYQFERHGYFSVDKAALLQGNLVFHLIVSLKDSWKKKM